MGRPPKDIKRDRQISIRFTDSELVDVVTNATAAGTTVSEYGRASMLTRSNPPAQSLITAEAVQQERLKHIQLRRIGNLLNQMVRHMHQTGEVVPDVVSLLQELRSIISGRGVP